MSKQFNSAPSFCTRVLVDERINKKTTGKKPTKNTSRDNNGCLLSSLQCAQSCLIKSCLVNNEIYASHILYRPARRMGNGTRNGLIPVRWWQVPNSYNYCAAAAIIVNQVERISLGYPRLSFTVPLILLNIYIPPFCKSRTADERVVAHSESSWIIASVALTASRSMPPQLLLLLLLIVRRVTRAFERFVSYCCVLQDIL